MDFPSTPVPFRIVVAGIVSEGGSTRPTKAWSGFDLQITHRPGGVSRVSGPMILPTAPADGDCDFSVEVLTSDFHDGSLSPTSALPYESTGASPSGFFGVPGSDWGQGLGDSVGLVAAVATALGAYLQRVHPVVATVVGAEVFCKFRNLDDSLRVSLTNRIATIAGGNVWNLFGPGPEALRTQLRLKVRRAIPDCLPPTAF